MTLSKAETDQLMLSQVQAKDPPSTNGEITAVTNIRHTSSVHPIDCSCIVCIALKHQPILEKVTKEKLGYFVGNSKE